MNLYQAFLKFSPPVLQKALLQAPRNAYPLVRTYNHLRSLGYWAERVDHGTASVSKGFHPIHVTSTRYAMEKEYTLVYKMDPVLIAYLRMELELHYGFKATDHDIKDALLAMAGYNGGLVVVEQEEQSDA